MPKAGQKYTFLDESTLGRQSQRIEGFEDVRLFDYEGQLMFCCSTMDFSKQEEIKIAVGKYNIQNYKLENTKVVESPIKESICEKNWIYVPGCRDTIKFIYSWYPMTIGEIDLHTNRLFLFKEYKTPEFFKYLRGSSNLCDFGDKLMGVLHFVKDVRPRQYYHCLVIFNKNTLEPEAISLPFCFRNKAIEYCLGFSISGTIAHFVFSENDDKPGLMKIDLKQFRFLPFTN
jgi:hypothetical protein